MLDPISTVPSEVIGGTDVIDVAMGEHKGVKPLRIKAQGLDGLHQHGITPSGPAVYENQIIQIQKVNRAILGAG